MKMYIKTEHLVDKLFHFVMGVNTVLITGSATPSMLNLKVDIINKDELA